MKKKIIVLIIQLSAILCLAAGCGGNSETGILFEESADREQRGNLGEDTETGSIKSDGIENDREGSDGTDTVQESEKERIYVQVSGAVKKPGVYVLDEGSRIFQAVELAGGVTELADTRSLNQAETLSDGQMIYVMEIGESEEEGSGPSAEQDDGKINLNTATETELKTLPGIGEAKAKSILAWREANGSFTQIEDLMKVEGIKDGVFSKIKDSVKVR